jgi:hypothetical protein
MSPFAWRDLQLFSKRRALQLGPRRGALRKNFKSVNCSSRVGWKFDCPPGIAAGVRSKGSELAEAFQENMVARVGTYARKAYGCRGCGTRLARHRRGPGEAVRLLKISANHGDADAQYDLGLLYLDASILSHQRSVSLGLPENWTANDEAERFMRAAARQGHIGAREFLEDRAPSLPIAKWLYIRGWYKGKIPGAAWILGAGQLPPGELGTALRKLGFNRERRWRFGFWWRILRRFGEFIATSLRTEVGVIVTS